jgi:hypothetical protein
MPNHSHDDQIEFSELDSEQISHLAKDYLDEKKELEESIRQIDTAKLISLASITIAASAVSLLASAPLTISVLGVISGLGALTVNTGSLAERLNELKRRRKIFR